MAAANPEDLLSLARKLHAKTGDRAQTVEALRGLGYSKSEAEAAVNQIDPAPAANPPAPGPKKSAPGPKKKTARRASPSQRPRTPPASPSSSSGVDLPRPTLRLPRRPDRRDVAGFGFGLVGFALFLQYLSYGPGGPTAWLKAKFLNQPALPADVRDGAGTGGAGADDTGLTSTRPRATRQEQT